jgi:rubrerythrin
MARHRCEICGAEFDTLSEYRRHMQTSHPKRAPSAADLEQALSGINYPASRDALARHAQDKGAKEIADILEELPHREYRDAADVARAFGGLRAHQEKATDQPSLRGGKAAMQSGKLSAARLATLFSGIEFPASAESLRNHARGQASDREMDLVARLPDRRYSDMADVEKAFGEVKEADRS